MPSLLPASSSSTAVQRATKRIDISLSNIVRSISSTLDSIGSVLSCAPADDPPGGVLAKADIIAAASSRYDTLDAFVAALASAANIAAGTADYTAPAIVTDGSASSITDQTATLNVTVNPGGLYSSLYFKYGVDSSYGSMTNVKTIAGTDDETNIALQLTGLSAATIYHYQVVIVNPLGTVTGADQTFTTAAAMAQATAEKLKSAS